MATLSHSFISLFTFLLLSPLSPLTNAQSRNERKFEIEDDKFWKDGKPFQIIGGDLHYFRVVPQYWEDRLLRAKALGLNSIQTYVPWNLHEPRQGQYAFKGIADIIAFLKLCQKLDLLVLLRAGPYICGEWDFGGFPAWLLAVEPALKLRSSDPAFTDLVAKWWKILLPKIAPFLYNNGGPIIMVQIENEYGSYADDRAYLHYLVKLARTHLGEDIILYTTDGGSRETLVKGTIPGDVVYSAVDFTTGDDPWPIFRLQKEFNAPGKSPPLSTEFYTGWLTHWGEKNANTDANFTAASLENILSRNGSAVLYMAHGGTNYGFYSGANTGTNELDYKPDLTSYDYDAPISESGDVDNAKYKAIREVIAKHIDATVTSVPSNNRKRAYGRIKMQRRTLLLDMFNNKDLVHVVASNYPLSMESVGQTFGFVLYVTEYTSKDNESVLSIPKVHDRAQVFISCHNEDSRERPTYLGTISRWSNMPINLPYTRCDFSNKLYILVENMGRVNYGQYIFDRKGILSSVLIDGRPLLKWKMLSVPLGNLNESSLLKVVTRNKLKNKRPQLEPTFYCGQFSIASDQISDTYISFRGWSKGIAFINDFNIGRFWPTFGPQCNLYVPAPILQAGLNTVMILELEAPNSDLYVTSVTKPDFTCGVTRSRVHQSEIGLGLA